MIIPSKVTEPGPPKKAKNMSSRGSRAAPSGSPRLGIAQPRCASQVIRSCGLRVPSSVTGGVIRRIPVELTNVERAVAAPSGEAG